MTFLPVPNLIVCSILKKEVQFLCEKNGWAFPAKYLCSSLHTDFDRLDNSLHKAFRTALPTSPKVVLYGTCHPLMERYIKENGAFRTPVQNCIELLLGTKVFTEELENGAFFLLEEWAHSWDKITTQAFGKNDRNKWDILHHGHNHILCLRTPCSNDFKKEAEQISKQTGMSLKWRTVTLKIMERHLKETIERAQKLK